MSATEDRDEAIIARIETLAHGMFTERVAADFARLFALARRGVVTKRWLVFNIGCIHCNLSSNVVGVYEGKEHAESIADVLDEKLWERGGGQNAFEVFDLAADMPEEYREALEGKQT